MSRHYTKQDSMFVRMTARIFFDLIKDGDRITSAQFNELNGSSASTITKAVKRLTLLGLVDSHKALGTTFHYCVKYRDKHYLELTEESRVNLEASQQRATTKQNEKRKTVKGDHKISEAELVDVRTNSKTRTGTMRFLRYNGE